LFHTEKESWKVKSGSVKILDWRTVLTIAAVQAKKPRDRIAIREIRVRTFTWRFQTMGIGRQANITSVTILMELLKRPIAVKVAFE